MFAFLAAASRRSSRRCSFVSILIFGLQQLLPGDPALVIAGEERDPSGARRDPRQVPLDQPRPVQYVHWIAAACAAATSASRCASAAGRASWCCEKLPVTLQLAHMAFVIACVIGIPAGVLSAVHKDGSLDYVANAMRLWGLSTPNFWLGIMLILLFSVELGWLPPSGYVSPRRISGRAWRRRSCRPSCSAMRSRPVHAPHPQRDAARC
jgi:peptide/nickel transport system permease protein